MDESYTTQKEFTFVTDKALHIYDNKHNLYCFVFDKVKIEGDCILFFRKNIWIGKIYVIKIYMDMIVKIYDEQIDGNEKISYTVNLK
jgi:hypothetical protein